MFVDRIDAGLKGALKSLVRDVRLDFGRGACHFLGRNMMSSFSERTKVNLTVVSLGSLLLGVAGGVAGAITTGYAMKEQVVSQVREERRQALAFYVTREELAVVRERDRDRLDAKLDELRIEVRALGLAVARLRR
jgi:hypothetical protein